MGNTTIAIATMTASNNAMIAANSNSHHGDTDPKALLAIILAIIIPCILWIVFTSIRQLIRKERYYDFIDENLADICASMQEAIIYHLMKKLVKASKQTGIKKIALAGGVSANTGLRKAIDIEGQKLGWQTFVPAFEYCTDNAAMIAITAHYKYLNTEFESLDVSPSAR